MDKPHSDQCQCSECGIWAIQEVKRLRELLESYGRHDPGCSGEFGLEYRCRCRWRELGSEFTKY